MTERETTGEGHGDVRELPLAAAHRELGASFVAELGHELPDDYGDAAGEQRHVARAVGLIDESYRGILDLNGSDVRGTLQSIVSSDVRSVSEGQGQASCLLSAKGRLVAAFQLFALPEGRWRLVFREPLEEGAVTSLRRYMLLADVDVLDRSGDFGVLALQGPASAGLLERLGPGGRLPTGALETCSLDVAGAAITAVRAGATPEGGVELWVAVDSLERVWRVILDAARAAGGGAAGHRAAEALRIEAGVARKGREYTAESFPNEVGWEHALTYDKCYVGQEIVARMKTYGQVHRRLTGVLLPAGALPEEGAVLRGSGDETIGAVTSRAESARLGCGIALALVGRKHWGLRHASVEGAGDAQLVALPLVPPP